MERKKIIITGADGYIGSNLCAYFQEKNFKIFPWVLNKGKIKNSFTVNITDENKVFSVIKKIKPDVIIHTAGISNLKGCEENKEFRDINVKGTSNIVKAINRTGKNIKLIFFSSDYVFDGKRGNYKEKDKRFPHTFYGKTKLISEKEIEKSLKDYIILRTANVYGKGGNFFNFLMENLNENKKLEVFDDVFYTPTHIDYLIKSIYELIKKDWKGAIHIAGREKTSRYQFALKMAAVLGKDKELIKPAHQPKGGLIAKNSALNTELSQKILSSLSFDIEKSLQFCVNNLISPYFYFKDDRGCLLGILQNKKLEEVNYIESKKGTKRGDHYHKKTEEVFFIIKGRINVRLIDIKTGRKKEYTVGKGDIFAVRPGTLHTFYVLEDSSWINMLSKSIVEGSMDMYKK